MHPPFLALELARETVMAELSVTSRLVRLAMEPMVAQFCRAKDHAIINEGTECVR